MKYLKSFKKFDENATASASSTSGMGAVSAAQPGSVAGTTGTTGSGDIGFTFKKEKRKKGDPTKVTDMRDLAPAKGITKLKESNSESRDPANDSKTRNMINDCIIELYDLDFELAMMDYQKEREFVDDPLRASPDQLEKLEDVLAKLNEQKFGTLTDDPIFELTEVKEPEPKPGPVKKVLNYLRRDA